MTKPGNIFIPALLTAIILAGTARAHTLTDTIARIASQYPGEIGIAVIINGSDTVTVNNSNIYPMMSVFKLHQALAVCHRLDRDGTSLDSVMTIDRYRLNAATWSPMMKEHTDSLINLSVRELLRYTLILSDNNASNLLFRHIAGVAETDSLIATIIPRASFRISCTEADMAADHAKAYSNTTSPLGAARLMEMLFTDSLVSPDKQRFLTHTLAQCATGTDRISAPLAGLQGVTVAHKTGSGYTTPQGILAAHNDVGRINLPDGTHYTLAVFVKDFKGNESRASRIISRISAAVYSFLTSPQASPPRHSRDFLSGGAVF